MPPQHRRSDLTQAMHFEVFRIALILFPNSLCLCPFLSFFPTIHSLINLYSYFPLSSPSILPFAACSGCCKGFTLLILPKQTPWWLKAARKGAEHERSRPRGPAGEVITPPFCPPGGGLPWLTAWAFIRIPTITQDPLLRPIIIDCLLLDLPVMPFIWEVNYSNQGSLLTQSQTKL